MMDCWEEARAREDLAGQIQNLVDGPSYILFFTKTGDVFGAPEESRVVFSRLKNPEEGEDWFDDDANFMATNLSGIIRGGGSQCVFGKGDMKAIKIIDKDQAAERLLRLAEKDPEPSKTAQVIRIVARETRGD
jgi:hypothetical protein